MKELKELAERYLKIVGKYDAGRSYKWSEAAEDLKTLENDARDLTKRSRSRAVKHLSSLLMAEIKEEGDRVARIH